MALTALHLIGLGCARNDVDSEELAQRFASAGYELVDEAQAADVIVVNTCGFIEAAKQESIDEIIAAASLKDEGRAQAVVAVGCLAQRYGADLADALPEADAVIGFDGYENIADTVRRVLAGERVTSHRPADRRDLFRAAPRARQHGAPPGTTSDSIETRAPWLPTRRRLSDSPMAPLKIASGCDRRCAFCAIPSFRGAFISHEPKDILAEARWLADQSVRELFLVSENTTSYGKDLDDPLALEHLLRDLSAVDGIERIRLSYLQPAEVKPSLIEAMATTGKVTPYFDLPFQHASGPLLRRMRRFGDAESFLTLMDTIRRACPSAGIRSNVIVGFPGETEADLAILDSFLAEARLDAVGVFAYSDEEGTEGATLDGHLDDDEIAARTSHVSELADTVTSLRAQERIGEPVDVLVEGCEEGQWYGRAGQQGPEDGVAYLTGGSARPGDIVPGRIIATDGTDWIVAAN